MWSKKAAVLIALMVCIPIAALAKPFAYITSGANITNVLVLDTATGAVTTTIPFTGRVGNIVVSPDGSKVYVGMSGGIAIIDTATNTVTSTVPVESYVMNPLARADFKVSPDGSKIYALTDTLSGPRNAVSVIDIATGTVIAVIPTVGEGDSSQALAVVPDGSKLYVANYWTPNVAIDLATNTAQPLTGQPIGGSSSTAVSPDGSKVYFSDIAGFSVFDTATDTFIARVPIAHINEGGIGKMALSPDGSFAYVLVEGRVVAVDTRTFAISADIILGPYGSPASDLAVHPDGSRLFVSGGALWVINTQTNTLIRRTIIIGASDIAITPLSPIDAILSFYRNSYISGTLTGTQTSLTNFKQLLTNAQYYIGQDRPFWACYYLSAADRRSDGVSYPADLLAGSAMPQLNGMIADLMKELNCQ